MDERGVLRALLDLLRALVDKIRALLAAARGRLDPWRVGQVEPWWVGRVRALPWLADEPAGALAGAVAALSGELAAADDRESAFARWVTRWQTWARIVAAGEATRIDSERVLASPLAKAPGAGKRWRSRDDGRVRAAHRAADGKTVPASGWWMMDGFPVRYPGDPLAPLYLRAGCRCRIDLVLVRSAL